MNRVYVYKVASAHTHPRVNDPSASVYIKFHHWWSLSVISAKTLALMCVCVYVCINVFSSNSQATFVANGSNFLQK
jgi:hypothetical protein